jgi:hypothetical protein
MRSDLKEGQQMNRFWRIAPWLTRFMLIPPTVIFALIASRYLFSPVQTGAGIGLAFHAPVAITIVRVGFGGFPLACAIFTLSCLASRRRVLIGLGFVAIVMACALCVRVFGMFTDGSVHESMGLVRAEGVMLVIFVASIFIERARRNLQVSVAD